MSDVIKFTGLYALGHHGSNMGERDHEQAFIIDLELTVDLSAVCKSDDLEDTIDYVHVYETVKKIVREHSYKTLERLAAEIADGILQNDRVEHLVIAIGKPHRLTGCTPSIVLNRVNSKLKK